jgi:pSer/pThr/pTyr-binding forkhead associated (FHA) protein
VSAYFDWWDGRERRALLLEGERLIVGSAPDSDLVVGDPSVSRIHAMLHQLNGRWFIEDCGSRNGTAVNGHQLTSLTRCDRTTRFGWAEPDSCSADRCRWAGTRPTR